MEINCHNLYKGSSCQGYTAKHAYAQLFPKYAKDVFQFDLTQGERTNDGNRGLSACVTARTHEHGEERGQNRIRTDSSLIFGDDGTGKGGGQHQEQ